MPERSRLRASVLAAGFAAALLLAGGSPAGAYTVYLKDGSRLVTSKDIVIQGEKALLTLESGTVTSLPLAEIDLPRTRQANENNIGTAIIIEGGEAKNLSKAAPPPRRATLQDLIKSREGEEPPELAPIRREVRSDAGSSTQEAAIARKPLRNVDLAETIRRFLFGRGITSVEVLESGSSRRPLLSFTTSNEGQVFKALAASANTLLHVRSEHPGSVEAFEILCRVPTGGMGGQFLMTPREAEELVSGRVDLPHYFVENVIF